MILHLVEIFLLIYIIYALTGENFLAKLEALPIEQKILLLFLFCLMMIVDVLIYRGDSPDYEKIRKIIREEIEKGKEDKKNEG